VIEKKASSRPLGEYLPCTREQLEAALEAQAAHEAEGPFPPLGQALLDAGAVSEEQLALALHEQRADRLRACPLFAHLPEEERRRLCFLVREKSLPDGGVLLQQDARGTSFFVIASGSVMVYREDEAGEKFPLATLGPGETVGEMGYFTGGIRSASVAAKRRAELLEIQYADLPRCFEAAPRLAIGFLDIVSGRLRETDLRYQLDVARRRTVERSLKGLSSLLDLSETLGMQVGIEELIERVVQTASEVMSAERASLFLVEAATGDLWSKVAEGETSRTIRVPRGAGIAGWVARHGEILNIPDAYEDERFNREIDRRTGYRTRSILCGPVRNLQGEIIGVIQVMNKEAGVFDEGDEALFRAFAYQAAIAVENFNLYRRLMSSHEKMAILLDVATSVTQTLDLPKLIQRIIAKTTEILQCDRGSLFLLDAESGELWSMEARGAGLAEIRFPASVGLAGYTVTTGRVTNVADAHEDPRFNARFDKETGYRTRSVLCVPVIGRAGKPIGVVQAINKLDGATFLAEDEELLRAIGSQISVALENAQLHARTVEMKNYLESIQQSISNAIVSIDDDGRVVTANRAALRMFGRAGEDLAGTDVRALLGSEGGGAHIHGLIETVFSADVSLVDYDVDVDFPGSSSVNVNLVPLRDDKNERRGAVLVLEDITKEKRVKTTLVRYMAKDIVDKMLQDPEKQGLGGVRGRATVLFSDIRSFTTLAEGMSAEQTMDFLNEYFTLMVDEVFEQRGVLDKFIGDAMLAVFGVPYAAEDDAERATRTALRMLARLDEFNRARAARGQDAIRIGIGINSGEVISGNMGSEKRMDFTVIGDGVNISSRLEGLTKQYGVSILVSEATRAGLDDAFVVRPIDQVLVKGKSRPVEIFEVVAEAGADVGDAHRSFLEGLEAYRNRDFDAALHAFRGAAEVDAPSALYAKRCEHFRKAPPPEDWNGVWVHETK